MAAVPWGSAAASQPGGNAYAANGRPVLEVGGFYSHQPAAGALTGALRARRRLGTGRCLPARAASTRLPR